MISFSMFTIPQIVVMIVFVFLYGIVIGSFLNVCIFRIPLKEEVVKSRSHCMKCGHILKWYELIPLFSWLIQGGKCRACKAKISKQYPIVEALNGVLWVVIFVTSGFRWVTLIYMLATSCLIVISVIDERTKEIHMSTIYFLTALGLIRLALDYPHWYNYVIGSLDVSLLFFLIILITKGRGMGGGDVHLMAAAGFILGWKETILAMIIGCVLGSIIHIIRMKVSKKDHELAFGPYLAMGIYLTFVFGQPILDWYLGFFSKTPV